MSAVNRSTPPHKHSQLTKTKKILLGTLLPIALLGMCGIGVGVGYVLWHKSQKADDLQIKIGISLPSSRLNIWKLDAQYLKQDLNTYGYLTNIEFAANDSPILQKKQIDALISDDCKILIVTPTDSTIIDEELELANSRGIAIICYDRLALNTDYVDYYATFDSVSIGEAQAESIIKKLDLDNPATTPKNIEIFTGPSSDNNVNYLFNGAMSKLQPYIASGKIAIKSGQNTIAQCQIAGWSTEIAQKRMEDIITAQNYRPGRTELDAILCSNDSIANGVTNAVIGAGFSPTTLFPIITGQDCDVSSVKNIKNDTQTQSMFKDPRILALQTSQMCYQVINNLSASCNTKFNNGNKDIPTYACSAIEVDKQNYHEILVDSGFYTDDQLT